MVAVALTPNMKLAAVCSAYFYSLFNLFAGDKCLLYSNLLRLSAHLRCTCSDCWQTR